MAIGNESVRLTEAQSKYLGEIQSNGALPGGLRLKDRVLEGSPDAIEALRERLTQLLAERGFAEDYSTTAEGELIEDLIDCLYLKLGAGG